MLKYYLNTVPRFPLIYFTLIYAVSVISAPFYLNSDMNIRLLFFILLLFSYTACIVISSLFFPAGPTPSDSKSLELETSLRNSNGGAGGYYDMSCLLPVKRKDYARYSVYVLFAMNLHHYELILISSFSKQETVLHISTLINVFHFLTFFDFPAIIKKPGKKARVFNRIRIIITLLLYVLYIILFITDRIEIIPIIPLPVKIFIMLFTLIYGLIFSYRNVFHGEFARNGEKIKI